MIDKIIRVIIYAAVAMFIILVHEIGHYLFGCVLGIPNKRMTIQMRKMPPHVALISDHGEKVSSAHLVEYVDLLERFLSYDNKIFLFVIGGHAIELFTLLTIALIAFLTKGRLILYLAHTATWIAPLLAVNYLLTDMIVTIRSKRPSGGDFSGSWEISRLKSILFYLCYFAGLAIAFLLARG